MALSESAMAEGSDHPPSLTALICGTAPGSEAVIQNALLESGISVERFDNLSNPSISGLNVDLLIGIGDSPDSYSILSSIRQQFPPSTQSPYTLLIVDSDAPLDIEAEKTLTAGQIDLILPLALIDSLPYILHTLQQTWQLRHELNHTRQSLAELRRSAAQLDLLREAIVQNVTHELRTPMLQVKSAVALLAEEVQPDNPIIDLALTATRRLETGVRNVTLLQELMNESFESKVFGPIPVSDLIHGAIRNLGRTWERKHDLERIVIELPDSLFPVLGDRQRLSIALQLLIDNALKFSQSAVHITAKREDTSVCFHIIDHGIGIPAHLVHRVVEPFFQIDTPASRKHGGMGIGLTIVKFILDQHNVALEINSAEGQGSTFSFRLPAALL